MASWRDRNPTPAVLERVHHINQIAEGAPKAIEFPHHDNIALAREREELLSGREGRAGAGELLAEELLAATVGKRVVLELQRLVLGGDPCIPNEHHTPPVGVSQKSHDPVELQQ